MIKTPVRTEESKYEKHLRLENNTGESTQPNTAWQGNAKHNHTALSSNSENKEDKLNANIQKMT